MHFLKVLFLLIVLVAVIEAQKGGTKSRPKPANVPTAPAGRKTPQPRPVQPKPIPQQPQEPDDSGSAGNAIEENNGESGPEPPAVVPQTSFTCDDKPYQPGMYADMEVDCSVYHMCFDGRKESFLCGTGTMFNQEILSCDHMGKVNCANSPQYYEANTELGKPGAEPASQPAQSGSKGAAAPAPAPRQQQPRPRVQQPSKTSQPRPAPAPKQQPKPFEEEPEEEQPQDEPEETPQPPPRPAPAPQPRPKSKTSPPKPRPQPAGQPKKAPAPKQKPIVQSFVDSEPENNVRRAYRARY